jgi:hypothetical protein
MINMGYCRFHNTALALEECLEYINDDVEMSEMEKKARLRLVALCERYVDEVSNLYEEDGDDDGE